MSVPDLAVLKPVVKECSQARNSVSGNVARWKSDRYSNLVSCSISQRQEQIRGGDEGCKFGGGEYRTGGL